MAYLNRFWVSEQLLVDNVNTIRGNRQKGNEEREELCRKSVEGHVLVLSR